MTVSASRKLPGQSRWRCCACGEILRSWAAAQRHADATRHGRIECVIATVDASNAE